MHVWLPEAHAAAPSHVSALMSGVLVKMGLYGLLRTLLCSARARRWPVRCSPRSASSERRWGSLSLSQRDMKRALAYSSIENVGIITIGLGIGFWGLAPSALPPWPRWAWRPRSFTCGTTRS